MLFRSTEVRAGVAPAIFNLALVETEPHVSRLARIDVFDDETGQVLARRVITKQDFTAVGRPQDFDFPFDLTEVSSLEFRVYVFGSAFLQHNSTTIYPDRLTLTALWNQAAHFEFRKRNVFYSHGVQDSEHIFFNCT